MVDHKRYMVNDGRVIDVKNDVNKKNKKSNGQTLVVSYRLSEFIKKFKMS